MPGDKEGPANNWAQPSAIPRKLSKLPSHSSDFSGGHSSEAEN